MTVVFTRAADARTVLHDLYNDPGDEPRLLAAAFPGLSYDLTTATGRRAVAADLQRPSQAQRPEPARQFASRHLVDTALGRPARQASPRPQPKPIGVLTLAADSAEDPLDRLTDTEWERVARRIVFNVGLLRWPRDHPWMVIRRADGVRLVTNTALPHSNLDDAFVTAVARQHLSLTRSILDLDDAVTPHPRADATTIVFRRTAETVVTAFGGDDLAARLMCHAGLRPAGHHEQRRHRSTFGDNADGAEHAARWAAELLHLAGYHVDVPADLGGHPATRVHSPAHTPAAAAVNALADVIATTDDPDQVATVLAQLLDPEAGVLTQTVAVLAAAEHWREAHPRTRVPHSGISPKHARRRLTALLSRATPTATTTREATHPVGRRP